MWIRWLLVLCVALCAFPAARAAACAGDCNDNDAVTINELVTMVAIALDENGVDACAAGDANLDGVINIDELVLAVTHALGECLNSTPSLAPCTGDALAACSAACGGPGRTGCCTLSSPPGCFDPSNGSITYTACGTNEAAACVLGGATPTATLPGGPTPTPTVPGAPTPTATTGTPGAGTQVSIVNRTGASTTVYVNFGADSAITQTNWSSFCSGSNLSCQFTLDANASRDLPNPTGSYLNMTVAFDMPVGCGATKAEVNVNNPSWFDILDISLVDGYSNPVAIIVTPTGGGAPTQLGPPNGETGNEEVYGVYPYGCDVCVARCSPPCGIDKSSPLLGCSDTCFNCESNGTDGCKAGTQSDPAVPCQYQGPQMGGGGSTVEVVLMDGDR